MGTYLSTPASEKYSEWGEEMDCPVQPLRFALVDMQGWRKSMEDAHVVETKVPYPPLKPYIDPEAEGDKIPKAKIFGVFDGHGGPEVARFCQLYIVSVLTKQRLWQFENKEDARDEAEAAEETDIGDALIKTFHALDRMIDDSARRYVYGVRVENAVVGFFCIRLKAFIFLFLFSFTYNMFCPP